VYFLNGFAAFRYDTVANLPAVRICNYLTFGASTGSQTLYAALEAQNVITNTLDALISLPGSCSGADRFDIISLPLFGGRGGI
jgi:hypothetical protein